VSGTFAWALAWADFGNEHPASNLLALVRIPLVPTPIPPHPRLLQVCNYVSWQDGKGKGRRSRGGRYCGSLLQDFLRLSPPPNVIRIPLFESTEKRTIERLPVSMIQTGICATGWKERENLLIFSQADGDWSMISTQVRAVGCTERQYGKGFTDTVSIKILLLKTDIYI